MDQSENGKLAIYLARHAQTSGNVDMKMMEAESDVLTELGEIQSNLLGMHLSTVVFDEAFASDYGRAIRTAEGILRQSKVSTQVAVNTDERLREINLGIYENKAYKELFVYCNGLGQDVTKWNFPDGESFSEVGQRMLSFIIEMCEKVLITQRKTSSNVLVISHSAAIATFLKSLYDSPAIQMEGWEHERDFKLMGNTNFMKIEVELGRDCELEHAHGSTAYKFKFVEKHYAKHINCVNGLAKSSDGIANFVKSNKARREYAGCIHQ